MNKTYVYHFSALINSKGTEIRASGLLNWFNEKIDNDVSYHNLLVTLATKNGVHYSQIHVSSLTFLHEK